MVAITHSSNCSTSRLLSLTFSTHVRDHSLELPRADARSHVQMPLHILSSTHVIAARSAFCISRCASDRETLGRSVLEALAVLDPHPVVALRPGAGGPIPPTYLQMHLHACNALRVEQ